VGLPAFDVGRADGPQPMPARVGWTHFLISCRKLQPYELDGPVELSGMEDSYNRSRST